MTPKSASLPVDTGALARSVVKLRAVVPDDAFTAGILGSERVGNGVVIDAQGLILTIGYLITEATDVWLTVDEGPEIAGHALAYDQVSGFGLVLPLERLKVPPLPFGDSERLTVGSRAYAVSHSGFDQPQAVRIVARREFTGAWEYLLESAIFTVPAHPHWSGAALIDESGTLVGVGSLLVREGDGGEDANANMFVPIDVLKPILEDLKTLGHADRPSRPWLGVYSVELTGKVYVTGVAEGSPGQLADIREGDVISHVADHEVSTLADFYRRLWALGPASVGVPLTLVRGGTRLNLLVRSVDRSELLKRPQGH
jgi:S1-C subfamily serine protease